MKSRIRRRLGRRFRPWGEIPAPSLPDQIVRLAPPLGSLPQNAVLRLMMFETAMDRPRKGTRFGSLPRGFRWALLTMATLSLGGSAYWLGAGTVLAGIFWGLIYVGWDIFALLLGGRSAHNLSHDHNRDALVILKHWIHDLHIVPLTASDFAVAQWGGLMLGNPFWIKHPAWALHLCCMIINGRCERESGWSFYPSTVGAPLTDDLALGKIGVAGFDAKLNVDRSILSLGGQLGNNSEPLFTPLGDQLTVPPGTFNYAERFNYLTGLWAEYLDIYHPEMPEEAEARKALRPGEYRAKIAKMIGA